MIGLLIALGVLLFVLGRGRGWDVAYRRSTNTLLWYYIVTTVLLFAAWKASIGFGWFMTYWLFGPVAALFVAGAGVAVAVVTVGVKMLLLIAAAAAMRMAQYKSDDTGEICYRPSYLLVGIIGYFLIMYAFRPTV